jgi:hypothetical protein
MVENTKQTIKHVTVVLNTPSSDDGFVKSSKTIHKSISSNTLFAGSAAILTAFGTQITSLEAAQLALSTKPPTITVAARDVLRNNADASLRILRSNVQALADANPAKAKDIIVASGMSIKKDSKNHRKYNTTKQGPKANSIIIVSEGVGPREWRISTDGITWTNLQGTTTASTTIYDLISGTEYQVQYRLILRNGQECDWSDSITFRL